MDRHSELELKFFADHVDPEAFKAWCMATNPVRFNSAAFPDVYWRRGDNVVRHRLLKGPGELTVKRRKSVDSIGDRQEIDLTFAHSVMAEDVTAFLLAAGWEAEFTLQKHFSYPFWFKHGEASVVVSLYEVERQDTRDTRRFLEVEVEKTSQVSAEVADRLLKLWSGVLTNEFDLADPLTESLYEMYSGRRYLAAGTPR
jgi:hypothetical protein